MISVDRLKKAEFLNQFYKYKYWFGASVLFFLAIVVIYMPFVPAQYQVNSKITTNNANAAADLKSSSLLQKTLDRLPFRVNYLKRGFIQQTEIATDSLPVKLVINRNANLNTNTQLELTVINADQFQITQVDTISSFRFNEAVNQPYGQFKVVKTPAFNIDGTPILLSFKDESQLFEEYDKNFKVNTGDDDHTLLLSVKVNSPNKGIDFLNKLLAVYTADHSPTPTVYPTLPAAINTGAILNLQKDIATLKAQAVKLSQEPAVVKEVTVVKEAPRANISHKAANNHLSDQQQKTLAVVEPYVKKSVNQFVQIPYSDEIKDADLRNMVERFNKMQVDKQRVLNDSGANNAKIVDLNYQLARIKADILENINHQTNTNDVDPMEAYKNVQPPTSKKIVTETSTNSKELLAAVNKQLQVKMQEYNLLVNIKAVNVPAQHIDNGIKIIERPGENIEAVYPNAILLYLLAIILGLIIPAICIYVINLVLSIDWNSIIDFRKLNEKLSSLVNFRQID